MKKVNRYFIFSDVHGEYEALMQSLQEAGYDSGKDNHVLVSLGDNFDRGPDSKKVWEFLKRNKAICVKGNHDAMFQEYLEKGMDGEFVLFNILHNGMGKTIESFSGLKSDQPFSIDDLNKIRHRIVGNYNVLEWIKKMPLFFETDTMVFVHAGIDPKQYDWKNTSEDYMLWDIEDSHKSCPNVENKIVVIGHHHAARVRENGKAAYGEADINSIFFQTNSRTEDGERHSCQIKNYGNTDENRPYVNGNKICIDGCTNLTKKVNVIVVEDFPKAEEEPKPEVVTKTDETTIHVSNDNIYWNYAYNPTTTVTGPTWFTN